MLLTTALLAAATPAIIAQQGPVGLIAGPMLTEVVRYGEDPRQAVTLYRRAAAGKAPLLVYLHGGGWSAGTPKAGSGGVQAEHWTKRGLAYATIGYRFVPVVTIEEQLGDVARAIATLTRRPDLDGRRIVLIGHSSGGHLAALLGTDPSWLQAAGLPFGAVQGVVLLDPTGLDLPPIMRTRSSGTVERYFRPAFGDDPARQGALSPAKHVEPPNAPAWLILHDLANGLAAEQGALLAGGLIGGGATAEVWAVENTTHVRLNDEIGRPEDRATARIVSFLAKLFPDRSPLRR